MRLWTATLLSLAALASASKHHDEHKPAHKHKAVATRAAKHKALTHKAPTHKTPTKPHVVATTATGRLGHSPAAPTLVATPPKLVLAHYLVREFLRRSR